MRYIAKYFSELALSLTRNEKGGVLIYSAFFMMTVAGAGALVLDVGRMSVLRTQMQNRADAVAMAAATQLDSRDGARTRATSLAMSAMSQSSGIPGDASELDIGSVNFYSEIEPTNVPATGDADSFFVEVNLEPRRVDFVLAPLGNAMFGSGDATASALMQADATAGAQPYICHAPPLMVCDPAEIDATLDLEDPTNAGRQIALKVPPNGGSAWAPGNYGLLALPDGSIGAGDIEGALAAVQPEECYSFDVTTAPGVKTNKVENGINARFDIPGGLANPAPNVINFPKDADILADEDVTMGSGDWDMAGYWADKHGGAVPAELTDATRYQVYLYELGETYARNGTQTAYPLDEGVPAGFDVVTPPGSDIPEDLDNPDDPDFDGVPSQAVAANGHARRLVEVAVLQCIAEDVRGSHSYPTNGNYIEMFITEAVDGAPAGGIYAEIVRPLTTTNDPDFHANVRLVR